VSDKSIEEEIKLKAQKSRKLARYMSSTQDLVENQIRKAMENGEFDNLAGSGKPLRFEENPYEPPELRMIHKILKDNDFAPYWIELGKEIDQDWEKLKQEVDYFKRYTSMVLKNRKRDKMAVRRYESRKAYFLAERRSDLEKISKKRIDYNLHCPSFRVGRANLIIDDEMYKIIIELESLIEELLNKGS
jgi:DnaJ family protein C protein 28